MAWLTEGDQNAPTAGTVMADGGPMGGAGSYTVKCFLTGSALGVFRIEHRNAANAANIRALLVRCPAGDSRFFDLGSEEMETDERIRVVMDSTIAVGRAQAALVS